LFPTKIFNLKFNILNIYVYYFLFNVVIIICIFSKKKEKCYWVGKDSLKCWRRMYLELFDYYVNNHDVPPNTKLPLNPDLLSAVYNTSDRFVEDKEHKKSLDGNRLNKMGGITIEAIDKCLKLARSFIKNSELIFKILKLNDYKPFHYSLLELESVLVEMMNILSSVIAKKNSDKFAIEEKSHEKIKINDTENIVKFENDSKTDDEHKDDFVEDNSFEEKEKHNDSDSLDNKNETECISWVFNEDITCPHGKLIINIFLQCSLIITNWFFIYLYKSGNLTIEKNTRRLVPEVVWGILHSYFPKAPTFFIDIESCNMCRVSNMQDNY